MKIIKSFLLLFFKKEVLPFALPLLLASCGNLPRPFAGNPGATAVRLAVPPVARLAVVTPSYAGFGTVQSQLWAKDVADALVAAEMPARVGAPSAVDWSVDLTITKSGAMVVPHYELHDGTGKLRGTIDGTPLAQALWDAGSPDVLVQSAHEAAPKLGDMLTQIEAVRMAADPNSLMNRAAKVRVVEGVGASGDGNDSLPEQAKIFLKSRGMVITDDPTQADFTLAVQVTMTDASASEQQVQIIWILTDSQGKEAGRIAQLNDIPAHSLDGYWGQVASVVAEQAASGVAEVIANRLPKLRKQAAEAPPQPAPPPPVSVPPAPTGPTAALKPPALGIAVQLGTVSSPAAATAEWKRLGRGERDLFQGRAPDITAVTVDGRTKYRLRTYGFATAGDAEKFCAALVPKHGTCVAP